MDTQIKTAYAIFETGGKQYQAIEGQTLAIEKLAKDAGESVIFDKVLLVRSSEHDVKIGQPYVAGAAITAVVVKHDKAPKVIVYRFKRRKKSRVKRGHRQPFTVVRVQGISA